MHFQFLIEDQSSEQLIEALMQKIVHDNPHVTYNCKSFRGIGGFTKKNTVKETKTGKLLNDLATYLRGFDKSLQHSEAAVFVVLDNDDRDCETFRQELEDLASQMRIKIDHVFCIAVEEVEAWLLGDEQAILAAYPNAKSSVIHTYEQDSICGTWELLAEAIYPGGLKRMKTDCPSYREKGEVKAKWAREIGTYMDRNQNKSQSFQYFMSELRARINGRLT